ncbi:MAG: C39 family peptidase [Methanobacteriaceae archaeon]
MVSENDTTGAENVTAAIPQIDTTGVVMQSTNYSCGPAALATVLQNIGVNSTEGDLKVLAGTDTSGTSMYGLVRAAKAKGLNATGIRLSIDDLRPNMIVHVTIDGEGHYSVVRRVTNESVYLADPSKGNIVLSREEFSAIFTGNVLVISDPNMQVNQTAEQANNTNTSTVQAENQTLTAGEMQTVRGRVIKVAVKAAAAGAVTELIRYLVEYRNRWTKRGVKNTVITGAKWGLALFGLGKVGRLGLGKVGRLILNKLPWSWRRRLPWSWIVWIRRL